MLERPIEAMMVQELTCRELIQLITDYLEGALAADDRGRFEVHLAECEGCTNYLAQMRRTIAAVGTLRESDLSPESRAALLTRFRSWNQPATKSPLSRAPGEGVESEG